MLTVCRICISQMQTFRTSRFCLFFFYLRQAFAVDTGNMEPSVIIRKFSSNKFLKFLPVLFIMCQTGAGFGEPSKLNASTTGSLSPGVIVAIVLIILAAGLSAFCIYVYREKICDMMRRPWRTKPSADNHYDQEEISTAAIALKDIRRHIHELETNGLLQREYEYITLNSYKGTTLEADKAQNRLKNRYANVLPFDSTRIVLRKKSASYINACCIPSFTQGNIFIAAQGPKENTIEDFWTMIWQENVSTIIMLSLCIEGGREKCIRYWPNPFEFGVKVGDFSLTNLGDQTNAVFATRELEITNAADGITRSVKHFHFISWPDFGAPEREEALLTFLTSVKRSFQVMGGRIVVHCSAGVGRTGTFIGLWNLIEQVDSGRGSISILEEVLNMRRRRMMMIQSKEQYLYIYKCIAAYCEDRPRWHVAPTSRDEESSGTSSSLEAYYVNASFEPAGDEKFIGNLI